MRARTISVTNPTSGARLAATALTPDGPGDRPVVVLVPGGLSAGEMYFGAPGISRRLAGLGYVVVHFDPDGRGRSGGREDHNGPVHQDGLAAIISAASALPGVDGAGAVVAAFCWGNAMAAGCLARHVGLGVRLFLDWEGPTRSDEVRAGAKQLGWGIPPESHDDGWWQGREAAAFAGRISAPYQRVQSVPNHLRTDPSGALEMLEFVTATEHGGRGSSPWTRLNGNPPNRVWSEAERPHWLPRLPAETAILPYLAELVPPVPGL